MSAIARWLLPASKLFQLGVQMRNLAFDRGLFPQWQAPVPVISVGNLSTGGTGKTPVAAAILTYLQQQYPHLHPAYLSRGYGRDSRGYLRLQAGGSARIYGDEAWQTFHHFPDLPIAVCESRKIGIQQLLADSQPDLIVLDDAFQHRWVDRTLNLVVINLRRPPWRDAMLPAGRLREPMSQLKRADLVILNHATDEEALQLARTKLAPFGIPIVACQPQFSQLVWKKQPHDPLPISILEGKTVSLLAGIGDPAAFEGLVKQAGAKVVGRRFLRDHQPITATDLKALQATGSWLLTTEKDYYRVKDAPFLQDFPNLPLAYLPIQLSWKAEAAPLWRGLDALVEN